MTYVTLVTEMPLGIVVTVKDSKYRKNNNLIGLKKRWDIRITNKKNRQILFSNQVKVPCCICFEKYSILTKKVIKILPKLVD